MSRPKLVLDTTYILPFFGIEVREISEETVSSLKGRFELIYPVILLPELWAKVVREAERRKIKEVPEEARTALVALLVGSDIKVEPPSSTQMMVAADLRLLGHKDMFDCLGYGCAVAVGGTFLTEDRDLRKFLKEKIHRRYGAAALSMKELLERRKL